jgi:RND family efflux transporter MFP subunit
LKLKRKGLWVALGVAVAVSGGFIGMKSMKQRQAAMAGAASAASAAALGAGGVAIELGAGDVARAERTEMTTTLSVTGGLKAVQSAVIKARVAAEVKSLTVREGDRVQAGQLIGHLDATEFQLKLRQAEDQANAAQAQLDIAQKTLDNNKALVDQGFISRTALDTSVSSHAGARASLQAAKAAADLARKAVADSEIRAPIAGLVAVRAVQPGERVPLDSKLVEIVDLSRIELEAAVAPEDVLALRVGQRARVQIDGLPEPVGARVARIAPSAQTGTRSVMAYLELDSSSEQKAGLRQGLFGRASIDLQRKAALVVPASAVRYDQARPYVLAVEGGRAVQHAVGTGVRGDVLIEGRSESAIEITNGLAAGAVVLRGTVGALREGTRLSLPAPAAAASTATQAAAASAAS